ncbi:hypothetical protein NQ038_03875 [Brevibacterium sp. 50QC2O2]|uniref:hypothetical protein n=1 Tax=Brevibacterium sp. 50QC2O2 TaxID=2968459 RepID=UPI00211CC888|nr:hypothetical protein [Brevibacterium sp. 50QC2O2]MCQ9387781.1 hypothetical protein [Brevibacterium sp. 50QC2O2]
MFVRMRAGPGAAIVDIASGMAPARHKLSRSAAGLALWTVSRAHRLRHCGPVLTIAGEGGPGYARTQHP